MLPIAIPGPITAVSLTDALGMNIEPLVFTPLIWCLRRQPTALGIVAAIGFLNREFTAYAVAALVAVDLLRDRSAALWRERLVAVVAFAITWTVVAIARDYSSWLGPGTTFMSFPDDTGSIGVAMSALCLEPASMGHDLWQFAGRVLPIQLGVGEERLLSVGIPSGLVQGYAPMWPALAAVVAFGTARGVWRALREGPSPATWFGLFLVLTGLQAIVVYGASRCGNVSIHTLRYTLLSLLVPAGAAVLAFERERRWSIRLGVGGIVIACAALSASTHARLAAQFIAAPPVSDYRRLADYLDETGIRYLETDYWTGYHVAFLTAERVKARTDFERIHEYTLAVAAHPDQTFVARRTRDGGCPGGVTVAEWDVCGPGVGSSARADTR
jgi:hypothetical protein